MATDRSRRPRILFFGMRCDFSIHPLTALLDAGFDVGGVVLPAAGGLPGGQPVRRLASGGGVPLPLLAGSRTRTIVDVAREWKVPVLEVDRLDNPAAVEALARERPDLICVACFPRRLPAALLAVPPLGGLNVHPSLLPANRGPLPLFWTFRNGETRTGVTVHVMDESLDAGEILVQAPIDVPDGIAGADLDRQCAMLGGRLLVDAVSAVAAGTATRIPQDHERASYQSWPKPADFVVDPRWSARHAFNFIRGAAHWGTPAVEVYGRRLPVAEAVAYDPDRRLGAPVVAAGDSLWLQCTPGILHVRVLGE